jgi:hypothetical protein
MNDEIFNEITTVFLRKTIECIEPWHMKNITTIIDILSHGFKTLFYVYSFHNVADKTGSQIVAILENTMVHYLEFVKQISDEEHLFLQLSPKDASLFTYKKMIHDQTFKTEDINKSFVFPSRNLYQKMMLFVCTIEKYDLMQLQDEGWWKKDFIDDWLKTL